MENTSQDENGAAIAPIETIENGEQIIETNEDLASSGVALPSTLFSAEGMVELLQQSKNLDAKQAVITTTAQSLKLDKKGEKFRGVFAGFTTMTVKDIQNEGTLKEIAAVRFINNGQIFINAGVVMVDEIKRAAIQPGVSVEICYTGKQGNTKLYSITILR